MTSSEGVSEARDRKMRAGALAFSAAFLSLLSVQGYETLGSKWPGGLAPLRINPNFPDTSVSGTVSEQLEILRCAARAWTEQSRADFAFDDLGTTTVRRYNDKDGVNAVFYSEADGGDALAATFFVGEDGVITSFDVAFYASTNGTPNHWSGPGEPAAGEYDIAGVLTHELGHCLGLDHSSTSGSTMFPSATARGLPLRTLHSDDRAGIEFVYGLRTEAAPTVEMTSVTPDSGPVEGGNEVVLDGLNFTYDLDSSLFVDGDLVPAKDWDVETCGTLRIRSMPGHERGSVRLEIVNSIGSAALDGAYRYGGPPPRILAVVPAEGPLEGDVPLAVAGEDFASDAVVFVGGSQLEDLAVVDSTRIEGILPAGSRLGPVDVRVEQGGDSSVLTDGFTYTPYVLKVSEAHAAPGEGLVSVPVAVTSPDAITTVSFGVLYDPTLVQVREISTGGTAAESAETADATIDNVQGVTTFVVTMSSTGPDPSLPAGTDVKLAYLLVDVSVTATPGASLPLRLADGAGSPPVQLSMVKAGDTARIRPAAVDGKIWLDGGAIFVRGDTTDDGSVNISDPIFLLNHLFLGKEPSPCPDAADANDDGDLDLSDAVKVLIFLFQGNGSPLPQPYPQKGPDPTEDDLGC